MGRRVSVPQNQPFFPEYFSCSVRCSLSQGTWFWFCLWGGLCTKLCSCGVHHYIVVCILFPLMALNQNSAFLCTVPPLICLVHGLWPGRGTLICVTVKNCIALGLDFLNYFYYCFTIVRSQISSFAVCFSFGLDLRTQLGACSSLTFADRPDMVKIRLKMLLVELFCSFKFLFIVRCQLFLLSGLNFHFFVYFKW